MTTIKSLYGKELEIDNPVSDAFADEQVMLRCERGSSYNPEGYHEGRMYRRADLLAALDAVPKMPEKPPLADRERDLLGPQNDDGRYWHRRAMENLRKAELATTRAEKAEAKLAEAATQRDEFEAEKDGAWAEVKRLTAERDALAATMDRIKARVESSPSRYLKAQLQECLDPKPAFVLPTEAGVRFEATDNLGHEVTFRAVWSGPHIMYLNESTSVIWNCDNLLADCTDFRLLDGAE